MKEERDTFNVSFGNLKTLEMIPKMMVKPFWRKQIRKVVLDFICSEESKQFAKCEESEVKK